MDNLIVCDFSPEFLGIVMQSIKKQGGVATREWLLKEGDFSESFVSVIVRKALQRGGW